MLERPMPTLVEDTPLVPATAISMLILLRWRLRKGASGTRGKT